MNGKKYDKDTALAKIKARISKYYEELGRGGGEEYETEEDRAELIEDIDEILRNTKISTKHVIIEALKLDEEVKKSLKEKWETK